MIEHTPAGRTPSIRLDPPRGTHSVVVPPPLWVGWALPPRANSMPCKVEGGLVYVFDGEAWVQCPAYVFDGSAWTPALDVAVFDGSTFVGSSG